MTGDRDKARLLAEAARAAARDSDPTLAQVPATGRLMLLAGRLGWMVALPLVVAAWGGHLLDIYFGTGVQIAGAAIVVAAVFGFSAMWRGMSR